MLARRMNEQALADAFLRALPEAERAGLANADLGRDLGLLMQAARESYPSLCVDELGFMHYAAERYQQPTQLEPARFADLYLCAGAAAGDGEAVRIFETEHWPELEPPLSRLRMTAAELADLRQRLFEELFVTRPDRRPKIAEFSGLGDLRGWLKVTAVRLGLKVLRGREHHENADELLEQRAAEAGDAELSLMKAEYRPMFKLAFQRALDSLPDRDRLVLKQHLLDGLSIDVLGDLHGVHRATAARWLTAVRGALVARTRRDLMRDANISARECDSVMKLVRSQLDTTIRRRLSDS